MAKKQLKYEEAFARLEQIVEEMNSASVPLDELMKLYEEGMELAKHCSALLKSYEARLEKVSAKAMDTELAKDDAPADPDDEEAPF